MSEAKLNVPELPATSGDYDMYISDVLRSGVDLPELEARFRANGGFARSETNSKVVRISGGEITETYSGNLDAVSERRSINPEQKDVVRNVSERAEELQATERGLQDTASFLQDIVSGKIPNDLLGDLLRANGGFARGEMNSKVVRISGGEITETYSGNPDAIRERRSINPEQKDVVRNVSERAEELQATERGLQDTASFLQDIVSGKIPNDLLGDLLRANGGFARSETNSKVVRISGGEITETYSGNLDAVSERRSINPEQKDVVRYVARSSQERLEKAKASEIVGIALNVIRSAGSSEAVKKLAEQAELDEEATQELQSLLSLEGVVSDPEIGKEVEEFLQSGNDEKLLAIVKEKGIELADVSYADSVEVDSGNLATFVQTARRLHLRGKFWQSIKENNFNPSMAQTIVADYEIVDTEDRKFVKELQTEGVRASRDVLLVKAFEEVSGDMPNFTQAFRFLGGAEKASQTLGDTTDDEVIAYAVGVIYDAEISSRFSALIDRLSLDRPSIAAIEAEVKEIQLRPALSGVEFFDKFTKAREKFESITAALDRFAAEVEIVELRKRFIADPEISEIVEQIGSLPSETEEDHELIQGLLDEFSLLVAAQRGNNPARFALLKEVEVEGIRLQNGQALEQIDLTATPEGRNRAAKANLVGRFKRAIMPLFESIRGGAQGDDLVDGYINRSNGTANRDLYTQIIPKLEKQRQLTEIERAYMQSVELLSLFNPHLVALSREAPELTSVYLENYFAELDKSTKERLAEDTYVPIIQIGLGPQGLAAAGEMARSRPDLSAQTLFIDAADQPGGIYGISKGPSWELNSASSLGLTTNVLPDLVPSEVAGQAVRAYSSPIPSYPGERNEGEDVRQGGINTTVDWLINPDNISSRRYPTNVDIARVLQLQSAMLVDNVLLSSRVTKVESIDDDLPGDKRVTVEVTYSNGEVRQQTLRTDAVILASGLGEPSYGLELEGSQAQDILIDNIGEDGFPLLTDTIGAFESLSNPEDDQLAPKGTVVIYGSGNSTDVLIEYLGRQFEGQNPQLNGVDEVIVIATSALSGRQRYAQINDLKSRNGQANFLKIVDGRVADVRKNNDGSLALLDADGNEIQVSRADGQQSIRADHVIAASGFRSNVDEVFEGILADGESIDRRQGLGRVRLPSNPGFSIADELSNDPNVVVVGTASRPDFNDPDKLAQLPAQAREALLRSDEQGTGAIGDNAVAIGFRAPDTRAAIRLKFNQFEATGVSDLSSPEASQLVNRSEITEVISSVEVLPDDQLPRTRREMVADSDTLSSLFFGSLPQLRLSDDGSSPIQPRSAEANPAYRFSVEFDNQSRQLAVSSSSSVPTGVAQAVTDALSNPYFQAYALKALKGRRTTKGLEVALSFSSGLLRLRDKGQSDSDDQRTYVEVL